MKPAFGRNKARLISLSPSQRVIKDFNQSEKEKYSSSARGVDLAQSSTLVWQVLYTTQMTQKAKKFHDGFLHLAVCNGSLGRQVMLYDENDTLLACRFLKKEEVIISGKRLTFDSYLVDIGDEHSRDNKPVSTLNAQQKDEQTSRRPGSLYSHKYQNNLIFTDLKKSEKDKFGSASSCLVKENPGTVEWQVLYTTQITQKAKKFHDGFLRLMVHDGLRGKQVSLFDEDGLLLSRRHIKSFEDVKSGITIQLPSYLVEVGQSRDDVSAVKDSKVKTSTIDDIPLSKRVRTTMPFYSPKPIGNIQSKTSPKKTINLNSSNSKEHDAKLTWSASPNELKRSGNTQRMISPNINDSNSKEHDAKLTWTATSNEPKRSAHDIMSILKKPMVKGNVATMYKPLMEKPLENHSSVVHSDIKNRMNEHEEEEEEKYSGSAQDELRESTLVHDGSTKIIKSEPVEIVTDGEDCKDLEYGRDMQAGQSRFHLRSEETSCMKELNVEALKLVAPALDIEDQMPITSALLTRSHKKVKLENTSEITSCLDSTVRNVSSSSMLLKVSGDNQGSSFICHRGASTDGSLASSNWTSHVIPDVEKKTLKQDFCMNEMNDLPSFDLGF